MNADPPTQGRQHARIRSKAGRKAPPGPVTPEGLQAAALRYLSRYASSRGNLRRVLRRRVDRAARFHDTDTAAAERWIDRLLAKLETAGLIDDAAYAEARARSLHRAGASRARIRAQLAQKGVGNTLVAHAVAVLEADHAADRDLDETAAVRYARRRRLGPYRDPAMRTARRDKDLAALARAGFALSTARRVIDADPASLDDDADR